MALNVLLDSKCKFFEQKESKQFKTYRLRQFYISHYFDPFILIINGCKLFSGFSTKYKARKLGALFLLK